MKRCIVVIMAVVCFASSLAGAEKEPVELGEIVVTASRYEEAVSSVPGHVTVISEEDIRTSTAQNIPDLLRRDVGIVVNDIAGNRRNVTVDVRGFGETATLNTLVLVDGRRVNVPDLSGTDWTQIPLERVERIEVVRGGLGSVLYGDNASGGVINIITKDGDAWKAGAGTSVGSYDTYKGNAFLSGSSDNLSLYVNGTYLSSNGYRDNSDSEAKDIGGKVHYYLSDIAKVGFSAGYHKDNTGLPGALKDSDFDAGVSRTDTVNPRDFAQVEDFFLTGGPEVFFWEDSAVKLNASYRKRSSLSFSSFVGGNFLGDTEIDTIALSPQVVIRKSVGGMTNRLTLGYDYQVSEEDILNNSSFAGKETFELKKRNYGLYIHDELKVTNEITLSAGYRYDRAKFLFDPGTPDNATMDEDLFNLGVNYSIDERSYAYVSYSRSYRYPVLDELFNFITNTIDTRLLPQKSDNYELGLRYYFADHSFAHINLFRIDTHDEIVYDPAVGFFGANANLDGKTRRDGVEVSLKLQPLDWLSLDGGYSYMKASIAGGRYEDSDIPNVPHHKATLGASVDAGKGFTISLNGVYVGERPFISDFTNTFGDQEDFTVLNGKISYTWKNVTAFLDVNNILDEEYDEYGTLSLFSFPVEKAFYPSPEANVLFGVSVEI